MREIKFRGKDVFTGEWRYGDLAHNKKVTVTGLEPRTMVGGYEADPDTVGQYAGLHDADGREIYEGDIVRLERDGLLYAVIFWEGMFYASVEACNRGIYGGFPLHSLTRDSVCRIVGNVHDNPGLLKD